MFGVAVLCHSDLGLALLILPVLVGHCAMAEIPGYKTTREILQQGSGPEVTKGCTATVHATGVVVQTGKKFWSTKDPGQKPFTYQAGVGKVITGWDQGCLGMQVGEARKLIIPLRRATVQVGSQRGVSRLVAPWNSRSSAWRFVECERFMRARVSLHALVQVDWKKM